MKNEYMVFLLKNSDYVQHSININSYKEAKEYCKIFFTKNAHYIITKIVKIV